MLTLVLAIFAAFSVLPAFSLLALTIAAVFSKSRPIAMTDIRQDMSLAVIVPAHNESSHMRPTLASIQAQLRPQDRLLVVADNCTDDTAKIARSLGAEVIERFDAHLRGKGFALAFGVDHLRKNPADVVVVIDADCLLSENALRVLASECHASGQPVQMHNTMTTPGERPGLRFRIIEFAMVMKNKVRPMGTFFLGQACHLMGTGMAFPWHVIQTINLATGHLAEDMKVGIELAQQGIPTRFLSHAEVRSHFLEDARVTKIQKSRWEHGHIALMIQELPSLLYQAWRQRDRSLIVLSMDMMIPPLALYVAFLLLLTGFSLSAAWIDERLSVMAWLSVSGFAGLVLAVFIGWWSFGRHLLSAWDLLLSPLYAAWKLPIYLAFFMNKRVKWKRTDRSKV